MMDDESNPILELSWLSLAGTEISDDLAALFEECKASGRAWNDGKNAEAKRALKAALFPKQKVQCAYCRRRIRDESGHVEIDHILPKAQNGDAAKHSSNNYKDRYCTGGYQNFTYEVRNLVLTCKRCNNKKNTFDSRTDRSVAVPGIYALDSDFYTWVHPHFDDYSIHIGLYEGLIYHAVNGSEKGDTAIRVCGLDSIEAVEALARQLEAKAASDYVSAIMQLLPSVSAIGLGTLVDAVAQAFPQTDRAVIEEAAADFIKTACQSAANFDPVSASKINPSWDTGSWPKAA